MRLLYIAFILSVTFPYTQLLPTGSYTQPYALMFGSIILAMSLNRVLKHMPTRDMYALIGLAWAGIAVFLITCFPYTNPQELKYLLNYLTPLVLTGASFATISAAPRTVMRTVAASVIIWFTIALIQTAIDPTFMTALVGAWAEVAEDVVSSGRGVLGLAPEPTHHGFHILLLGAVLVIFGRWRWLVLLCVAEALLLARSSSCVLALALGLAAVGLARPARLVLPVSILAGVVVAALITLRIVAPDAAILPENSRMLVLATAFLENPSNLLALDYSVSSRIGGMIATFIHTVGRVFLPNGLSHDRWLAVSEEMLSEHNWLLGVSDVGPPSGIGVLLFQVGFLALPSLAIIWWRVLRTKTTAASSVLVFTSFFIFLGQYYISAPTFSLLYAAAIWQAGQVYRARQALQQPVPALAASPA